MFGLLLHKHTLQKPTDKHSYPQAVHASQRTHEHSGAVSSESYGHDAQCERADLDAQYGSLMSTGDANLVEGSGPARDTVALHEAGPRAAQIRKKALTELLERHVSSPSYLDRSSQAALEVKQTVLHAATLPEAPSYSGKSCEDLLSSERSDFQADEFRYALEGQVREGAFFEETYVPDEAPQELLTNVKMPLATLLEGESCSEVSFHGSLGAPNDRVAAVVNEGMAPLAMHKACQHQPEHDKFAMQKTDTPGAVPESQTQVEHHNRGCHVGVDQLPSCPDVEHVATSGKVPAVARAGRDVQYAAVEMNEKALPLPGRLEAFLAEARQLQRGANDALAAAASACASAELHCDPKGRFVSMPRQDNCSVTPDGFAASELGMCAPHLARRCMGAPGKSSIATSTQLRIPKVEDSRSLIAADSRVEQCRNLEEFDELTAICGGDGERSPTTADASAAQAERRLVTEGAKSQHVDKLCMARCAPASKPLPTAATAAMLQAPYETSHATHTEGSSKMSFMAAHVSVTHSDGTEMLHSDTHERVEDIRQAPAEQALNYSILQPTWPNMIARGLRVAEKEDESKASQFVSASGPLPEACISAEPLRPAALSVPLPCLRSATPEMTSPDVALAPTTPPCAAPDDPPSGICQMAQRDTITRRNGNHQVASKALASAATCQEIAAKLCIRGNCQPPAITALVQTPPALSSMAIGDPCCHVPLPYSHTRKHFDSPIL
jgi:hypothetical protein